MAKFISRPRRWAAACAKAQEAKSKVESAVEKLNNALEDLRDIQSEYESWKDNLPENLSQSPLGEKLEAMVDLDLSEIEAPDMDVIDEADGIELPRGFGKD